LSKFYVDESLLEANEFLEQKYGISIKRIQGLKKAKEEAKRYNKQLYIDLINTFRSENEKLCKTLKFLEHKIKTTQRLICYAPKRVNLYNHYNLENFDEIFNYDAQNQMLDKKTAELFTYPIVMETEYLDKIFRRSKVAIYARDRLKNNKVYQKYIFLLDKNSGEPTPNLYVLVVDLYSKKHNIYPNLDLIKKEKLSDKDVVFGINLFQILKGDKKLASMLSRTDLGDHEKAKYAHLHVPVIKNILNDSKFKSIYNSIKHCSAEPLIDKNTKLLSCGGVPMQSLIDFAVQKFNIKNLNTKTLQPIENFMQGSDNLNDIISSSVYNEALSEYCNQPYTLDNNIECYSKILKSY